MPDADNRFARESRRICWLLILVGGFLVFLHIIGWIAPHPEIQDYDVFNRVSKVLNP